MNNTPKQQNAPEQSRVARRRARVRAELLAAARQVFARRGYQDATITEITELADVAMGTFYLHFRDKAELFAALAAEGLQTIREQLLTVLAKRSGEQTIPLVIRTLLQSAYEQRDLFLLICAGEGQSIAQTYIFSAEEGLAELLLPALQAAKDQGQLATYDPVLLARLMMSMIIQAITWWLEYDEPGPDVMAEHILYLLGRGLPAWLLA